MLSKNTPPGTRVVGIAPPPAAAYVHPRFLSLVGPDSFVDHEGVEFTVLDVVPHETARCGYGVIFEGQNDVHALECYRRLELPRSLRVLVAPGLQDA